MDGLEEVSGETDRNSEFVLYYFSINISEMSIVAGLEWNENTHNILYCFL